MSDSEMPQFCMQCGATLSVAARFCTQCGKPLEPLAEPPAKSKWYHNIVVVLLLLFFVLGPFGLPLVWKNPRLSRTVKWVLTLAMMIYTVLLIQLTVKMVQAISQSVTQMTGALQPF